MALLDRLNTAADSTTCQFLGAVGQGLIGSAVWNFGGPKVRAASLGLGGLSLLASNYLCPDQEVGNNPDANTQGDCWEVDGLGTLIEYSIFPDGEIGGVLELVNAPSYKSVVQILGYGPGGDDPEFNGVLRYKIFDGSTKEYLYRIPTNGNEQHFTLNPNDGSNCIDSDKNPPPVPIPDTPYTWVDQSNNCTYNLTPLGFADGSPDGSSPGVVYLIEAAETRSSGGRIGGCNFAPTIYYGGGGGEGNGPRYYPAPDNRDDDPDGVPWWLPPLVAGAASGIVSSILDALVNPGPAPEWEDTTYAIQGICETVADGDIQPILQTPVKGGVFAPTVISRLDALTVLLQYHLSLKTPICTPEKPALEGQWVTTQWESDEKMVDSGRRLRKLFRYRTKSARDLGQLSAYWESFTWTSGPVIVFHKGAWWGTPKVWASTEEEGQRVLRFAAAEAGLDPDQVGEWGVSSSRSARYGMPGTMRIKQFKGFPWVAKRDGSEWPNMLAKQRDP
jgi:hypothetical protein